ncbi:MAG: SigF/SigG family RNA polymerase sporulation sigma factor [Blautia sp.]
MEHTLALIGRAHQGDKEARDTLFEENTGLIYSVARRFLGRGVEMEDLFQIGSIGLLKAVDKFDPAFEVKFSTYAIPMILGELKRFFRDDGMIKVSRSIKENQHRVYLAREKIEKELGREPSLKEIAEMLGMPPEEVAMTMDSAAEVESLYRTVYQSEGTDISLIDKIPEKENAEEHLLNRIFLEEILGKLESSDRKLLYMRYFQDQTQTQIAEQLGVSQVQVSRMEKRILKKLRSLYRDG